MRRQHRPTYSFDFILPSLRTELQRGNKVAMEMDYFRRAVGQERGEIEKLAARLSAQLGAEWSYTPGRKAVIFKPGR